MVCFHWVHFLNMTYEVESYHSGLLLHVYLDWLVAWLDVGGGYYSIRLRNDPYKT